MVAMIQNRFSRQIYRKNQNILNLSNNFRKIPTQNRIRLQKEKKLFTAHFRKLTDSNQK